jgi:hypothetical protein
MHIVRYGLESMARGWRRRRERLPDDGDSIDDNNDYAVSVPILESISNSRAIPRASLKYLSFSARKPSRGLPVEAPNRRSKQNIFLTRAIA